MRAAARHADRAGSRRARTATAASRRTSTCSAGCARASSRWARTCCARRSTWLAQHQPARPGDLPHPPRAPSPHRRRVVHLPDVRLRAPIEDALENITHSICTLEFEDHRPLYDWLLGSSPTSVNSCAPAAAAVRVRATQPHVHRAVQAQAHPARRRPGTSTAGTTRACRRSSARGVAATRPRRSACSPSASACRKRIVDRDDDAGRLPPQGSRRTRAARHRRARSAEARHRQLAGRARFENCEAPVHPHHPELGNAHVPAGPRTLDRARRLRRDAAEGLLPALPRQHGPAALRLRRDLHRLRQGRRRQHHGRPLRGHARLEVRHAGRRQLQGEGQHPLGQRSARARRAEVRLYDRLFTVPAPGAGDTDYLTQINPDSVRRCCRRAKLEPACATRSRKTASSSSATAISWRTRRIRSRARRCSTGR
jgi:glutaminyl-tRNA synthetase